MRKNRKIRKEMSVIAGTTVHFGAIVAMLFVMVILNLLANSRCQQLSKAIGEREKELDKLVAACQRESTRWEQMKTPEKIESALLRHGLSMKLPRAEQNVRMKADGTPCPAQLSVARAAKRRLPVAQYVRGRR